MFFSLSLRKKFIIGTALLILMVVIALGLLVRYELNNRFEEELHKRGISIARYIAEAAEIPLITENNVSLRLLVNDYRKIDHDIEYIYILNPKKKLVTHTFGTQIPENLIKMAHQQCKGTSEHFIKLDSSDGLIYDISVPIQKGALGTVHIGLFESVIQKNVHGVLIKMLPFVILILALGITAAMIFAAAITRPVALLTMGVKRFSDGELHEPLEITTQDEIGQLASAFNDMTEKLLSTTVSRKYMEKLIDSMNDVLIVIAPDGIIKSVNRAYFELFGFQPDDIIGHTVEEFNVEGGPRCIFSGFSSAMQGGSVHGIECSCRTASGEEIPMLFSMAVMKDESNNPQAVICAAQSIKSLKQVQDELRHKQSEMEEINRNLEQIVASRTAELAIGNEGLRAEVAERQRKTEELRAARDTAESANRAKSEFLANMSHEMRTPLNSIIGGADYLDNDAFTPEQQRCLTMIRQAGDSLLTLINDLIDLSRIEAGQLEIVKLPFNLLDTIDRVILMLGRETERKGIELMLQVASEVPYFLTGDQMRLQQILINLLSNAIKFTDTGGTVSVAVSCTAEQDHLIPVTFLVRDSGIGIDPLKLNMIFESFAQADASITRRYGGSGLGLAISRKLVEAMGGNIQVESVPEVGSSFSFTIGFAQHENNAEHSWKTPKPESAGTPAHEQALQAGDTRRVLLVDDALENRELMRLLFLKLPLTLDEAINGQEAYNLFEKKRYDLIFMDIQMPIMDGYTATRMIRSLEKQTSRKRTTIIALTAHAYEEDIRACLEAGCDDHIAKPFKKKTLMQCLSTYLRGIVYEY